MRVEGVAGDFSDDPLQIGNPPQRHGKQEADEKGEGESLRRFLADALPNGVVSVEEDETEEVAEPLDAEQDEEVGDEHERPDFWTLSVQPLLDLLLREEGNPLASRQGRQKRNATCRESWSGLACTTSASLGQ